MGLIIEPTKKEFNADTIAFDEGREFRGIFPLDLGTKNPTILKIVAPIDFILKFQSLNLKSGEATMLAYRLVDGTESGVFALSARMIPNNFMSSAPNYTQQVFYYENTTGNFVPNDINDWKDKLSVKVATATGQQTTVGGDTIPQRGLPAGTYYLIFSGTGVGDFYTLIEERP